mgnify:CR=1 FL=1
MFRKRIRSELEEKNKYAEAAVQITKIEVSFSCSKTVTESYSTSFSLATKMLHASIRGDIYNIYGFVRFADEIVDTFHEYDKSFLFNKFEQDLEEALNLLFVYFERISTHVP